MAQETMVVNRQNNFLDIIKLLSIQNISGTNLNESKIPKVIISSLKINTSIFAEHESFMNHFDHLILSVLYLHSTFRFDV